MSDLIKEIWFKWRARVYFAKVEKAGIKRLELKGKQIEDKATATEYLRKYKEISRI